MSITYNYLYPAAILGGSTGPTLAQSANVNLVVLTIAASAAGDVSVAITHNFNLSNADISSGFPMVEILAQDGSEVTSPWFELSEQPNFTVLGKSNVAAGGQAKVFISRPHTIFR